jgi:transcriptional regulator with XRE-family HTH domain
LRTIRVRAGLTQHELTAKIGIKHRASIAGYERGDREPPLPALLAYARLAAVDVEILIDDALELPNASDHKQIVIIAGHLKIHRRTLKQLIEIEHHLLTIGLPDPLPGAVTRAQNIVDRLEKQLAQLAHPQNI